MTRNFWVLVGETELANAKQSLIAMMQVSFVFSFLSFLLFVNLTVTFSSGV